jgi:4-hydroxy-tetrahydrodipicolinate synthase
MSEEFHISPAVKGLLLSAFFWTYALFQIPSGWLLDRFGPRVVYPIAVGWWSIWTALAVSGGWRLSFIVIGAAGLLWILGWVVVYRNPEQHHRVSAAELAHIRSDQAEMVAATDDRVEWRPLLRNNQVWALTVGYVFRSLAGAFFLTWYPSYLLDDRGFSEADFGMVGAIPAVIAIGSTILGVVEGGVEVLTPNDNTGEFYAPTPDERRAVLTSVTAARGTGTTIVAGVGFDVRTAIADARFARDAGADAIMIHQPVLPYLAAEGWVEYNAAIAAAVPDIGVLPYLSNPAISGVHIGALAERAPNVVGLKYSVPDPVVFATTCAQVPDRLLWIAGLAESYAPAYWQAGARAFTSGLVNVAPAVSLRLLAALRAGDYAEAMVVWRQIRHFEELRARDRAANNVSVVKEAMHQLGLCRRDLRPPSHVLSPALADEVAEAIRSWT